MQDYNFNNLALASSPDSALAKYLEIIQGNNYFHRITEASIAGSALTKHMESMRSNSYFSRISEISAASSAIAKYIESMQGNNLFHRMAEASIVGGALTKYMDSMRSNSYFSRISEISAAGSAFAKYIESMRSNNNLSQAAETVLSNEDVLTNALDCFTRPGHLNALIESIDKFPQKLTTDNDCKPPANLQAEHNLEVLAATDTLESFSNTLKELPDNFKEFLFFLCFLIYTLFPDKLSEPLLQGFGYMGEQLIPGTIEGLIIAYIVEKVKYTPNANQRDLVKDIKTLPLNIPQSQLHHLRFVTRSSLNIYSSPNSKSSVLHTLVFSQVVTLLSRNDSWAEVLYESEDEEKVIGWVFVRYLSKFRT